MRKIKNISIVAALIGLMGAGVFFAFNSLYAQSDDKQAATTKKDTTKKCEICSKEDSGTGEKKMVCRPVPCPGDKKGN